MQFLQRTVELVGSSADGNAFLVAASGVGGISAALAIALAQSFRRRGWLLRVGFAAFGTFA